MVRALNQSLLPHGFMLMPASNTILRDTRKLASHFACTTLVAMLGLITPSEHGYGLSSNPTSGAGTLSGDVECGKGSPKPTRWVDLCEL